MKSARNLLIAVALATVIGPGPASAGRAYVLLSSRSEASQLAAFAGVIASSGGVCRAPSRLSYLGDAAGAGFWTVRCEGGDYLVMVDNEGSMSTRVLECAVAQAAGATCWKPF
jgi:hypothetical protein